MGCYINFKENMLDYDVYTNPKGCGENEDAKTEWINKVGKKVTPTYVMHKLFDWNDTSKRPVIRMRNFGFTAMGVLYNRIEAARALTGILNGQDERKCEVWMVDTDEIRKVCPIFVRVFESRMTL